MKNLEIGTKVKFTTEVINLYKERLNDKDSIEIYGKELMLKSLARHQAEHTITKISSDGQGVPIYFLSGMRGSAIESNLIVL